MPSGESSTARKRRRGLVGGPRLVGTTVPSGIRCRRQGEIKCKFESGANIIRAGAMRVGIRSQYSESGGFVY